MKNRTREICTSGSARDEDGQPPHLLGRRQFLRLAAGAAALPFAPHVARAQAYPARPVRIIVGFPAGGGFDVVARPIEQSLSERLGQSRLMWFRCVVSVMCYRSSNFSIIAEIRRADVPSAPSRKAVLLLCRLHRDTSQYLRTPDKSRRCANQRSGPQPALHLSALPVSKSRRIKAAGHVEAQQHIPTFARHGLHRVA
jgi:hypothetical protein